MKASVLYLNYLCLLLHCVSGSFCPFGENVITGLIGAYGLWEISCKIINHGGKGVDLKYKSPSRKHFYFRRFI